MTAHVPSALIVLLSSFKDSATLSLPCPEIEGKINVLFSFIRDSNAHKLRIK